MTALSASGRQSPENEIQHPASDDHPNPEQSSHSMPPVEHDSRRGSAATLVDETIDVDAPAGEIQAEQLANGGKKAPPASMILDKPPAMRSMFPTYDTERPLQEQYYLPSQMSPRSLPMEAICKSPYSATFDIEEKNIEKSGLIFKPIAEDGYDGFTPEWELPGIWSSEAQAAQDYRLRIHTQPKPKPMAKRQSMWRKTKVPSSRPLLTFGPSTTSPYISVNEGGQVCGADDGKPRILYTVQKHGLNRFSSCIDVTSGETLAGFSLQQPAGENGLHHAPPELEYGIEVITTFVPHDTTTIKATGTTTSSASSSPQSRWDSDEHDGDNGRSRCYIVLRTYPGQRRPCYALKHPSLGFMRLKVHGDVRMPEETADTVAKPEVGKIELLAPIKDDHMEDTDPLQIAFQPTEPEIVLASIDLAASTLFIDGAALADVGEPGLIDTALSSLIAVVLAETNNPRLSQQLKFEPPPMSPTIDRRQSRMIPLKRTQKAKKANKKEKAEMEVDQTLTTMFGMLTVVVGVAVEKLGNFAEKRK